MEYSNGTNQDQNFYLERKALKTSKEEFALGAFSSKKVQPQKNGHIMKCVYYEHLPDTAIQDLAEGVAVAPTNLTRVTKQGTLKRQSGTIEYTDEMKEMYDIDFLDASVTELSYSLGTKLDKDAFAFLLNDSGNTVDVTTSGSWDEALKSARKLFRKGNVPQLTKIKTGSTKVGTKPVNAGWYMFIDVDDADAIREASDFLSIEDYGYTENTVKNEIGVIKSLGIRIVESLNIGSGMALMIGDEAFADLGLGGKNRIEVIESPLGSGVVENGAGDVVSDWAKQKGAITVKSRNNTMTLFPDRLVKFTNLP